MNGTLESYFKPDEIFQEVDPSGGRGNHPFYVEVVFNTSNRRVEFPFHQMD